MTSEAIQKYKLRITEANKTELIVILYEMSMDYAKDAIRAHGENDRALFRKEIKRVRGCLLELMDSLHLEHELAKNYLKIYSYINRELAMADGGNTAEPLEEIIGIISQLHEAYREVSKQDSSLPVMANTQSVYAGLTYGKNNLNENLMDHTTNRGFLV
ncbi:MAG: flagellar protein FliS [Lachnospiraceae bacterium]|nr:flagellar protein FliS [Lachnospiraceae bacterium]